VGHNWYLYPLLGRLKECFKLRDVSAFVKRRTLFTFRVLSEYEPALMDQIGVTIIKMLEDLDNSVVRAALTLIRHHPSQVSYGPIPL